MGMICMLSTISDESIRMVLRYPGLAKRWFYPEDDCKDMDEEEYENRGFWGRLFGSKLKLPEYYPGEDENTQYDIDKAWHGIHFLLTGSARRGKPPLNFLIAGGAKTTGLDIGYGPGRMFISEEVKKINDALQNISTENFKSRFDSGIMMSKEIYPTVWDRQQDDDNLEYISDYFNDLKEYIHRACEQDMGIVIGLT